MLTAKISKDLDMAMSSIEELLNGKDGEFILEAIRNYKKNKNPDSFTLLELRRRLHK